MTWSGKERRRAIRVEYPYTITIHTPQASVISTYTENFSAEGIKVVMRENLRVGSLVELKIHVKENLILCKGEIRWVKDKESRYAEDLGGGKLFETGISFYEIKEEDLLIIKDCEQKTGE